MGTDDGLVAEQDLWTVQLMLVPGVGPRTRAVLLAEFGSAEAILSASRERLLSVPGVGPVLAERLREGRSCQDAADVVATCREHGLRLLLEHEDDYPPLLHEIYDPPGLLFLRGSLEPRDRHSIAIVGTRHATRYGMQQAQRLARELATAGFTIISGLARGIDAAAHRGALEAGGRTIAVLGGGILRLYPPEHHDLAVRIAGQGGVLSEAPPLRPPSSGNFPQRNRIISGMAFGVIVVEAGSRSGALITTQHALEQGREVFAVPGPVDSPVSRGCHQLLRDGAKLVESIDDIVDEFEALAAFTRSIPDGGGQSAEDSSPSGKTLHVTLDEREQKVWNAIKDSATFIDQVIVSSGLPAPQVLATLSRLEMKHVVRRIGGAAVERMG